MNEAASVLKQTNHERKVAGYGAHHKKGGSAVSKLGNKPLSWQEINSKHGECKEFDLGGFMDYETFKKMDPDLEVEYVNKLCEKYHVRHEQVSKWLFGLGENDLMARLKIKGVDKKIVKIKAADVTDNDIKDFHDLIEIWRERVEAAKIIDLSEAQRRRDIIENAELIGYEEFSSFTTDEKILYLNSLINKYGVSLAAIERELFKLPVTNLRHKLDAAGVLKQIKRGKNGFNAAKANKDFCDILKVWRGETTMAETKKENTIAMQPTEDSKSVARDILASIIGEDEPESETKAITEADEESKSTELPESYIPIEKEPEAVEAELEETLVNTPVKVETIEKSDDISAVESNRHNTVFSANYRSVGMDCDELDALKLMFKNKLVEVCITVRTI